jgi:sulfoxide reductase heme-binding subunit YedZ
VIVALAAPSEATSLWYLTRGTGTVALVLLTAILVLGVLSRAGGALPACPRFVTPALHRNLSLLAVILIAVHVVSAVLDPYAPIRVVDAVVPLVSAYRPIWLGLGALTFDLLIAVIVTSLVRVRLGQRAWRAVHWAAYACWPLAVAHALGSGTDARSRWLLAVMAVAGAAAVTAVVWRAVGVGSIRHGRRWIAVGATVLVPLALAGFAVVGPLAPHWAARAGTPAAQRAATPVVHVATIAAAHPARPAPAGIRFGTATFSGHSVVRHRGMDVVVFAGALHGTVVGRISIRLTGHSAAHGGIGLSAGSVLYTKGASKYRGLVTSIRRDDLGTTLVGPGGRIQMVVHLAVARSLAFTGRVTLS